MEGKGRGATELNDFDRIAGFYDELVSWAPYELWINDLLINLEKFGLREGGRILDAACGSGLSTLPMARRGFIMTGIDRSRAMLELAREKSNAEKLPVKLQTGDLLDWELHETFNAAICLHSGLDYILELENLQKAFSNVRQCLQPGGLFAFDKCLDEPQFYRKSQRDRRQLKNGRAVIDYRWDRVQKIFEQDCRIYFTDEYGMEKSVRMLQRMLAVPLETLLKMVEASGFETLKPPEQFTVADPGMGIFRAV